jgi:hypothetical protein
MTSFIKCGIDEEAEIALSCSASITIQKQVHKRSAFLSGDIDSVLSRDDFELCISLDELTSEAALMVSSKSEYIANSCHTYLSIWTFLTCL